VSPDAARAHPFGDRGDDLSPGTAGRLADRGAVRAFCGICAATAPSATSTAPTSSAPTSSASAATAASATAASATSSAATTAIATTASAATTAHASAASAGAATATTTAVSVATAARANGHRDSAGARRHDGQRVDVPDGRLELVIARRRQSAGRWVSERLFGDKFGSPRSAGVRPERRSRDSRAVHGRRRLPAAAQAL
jgi:hypothetical protein